VVGAVLLEVVWEKGTYPAPVPPLHIPEGANAGSGQTITVFLLMKPALVAEQMLFPAL
jgi:hypothetical protein